MDSVVPLPYTRARIVNNFVLSSGHVPLDADGNLVSTQFVARQEDFDELNALCREAFPEPFPTRTTVVVDMARPGILIEIEPTAVVSGA